ncbi:MAG: MBL fold metallo-hydrolase [Gammaproteobacteria bacterium]|nr:MBL fold metallo-hydrolase [Gammaproteobacteria bacterium]
MLIDFANMHNGDEDDKRCNLSAELRTDLDKAGRDRIDAVCITHLDRDHCNGFGDFFWLSHAAKYQDDGRIKIGQLWVPAAAILEDNLAEDARIIRSEARHRLREGKGILVFSYPERLKDWMEKEGIDYESRKHLIVDAGKLVPGFAKNGPEGAEFFVHCPFAWRQDENTVVSRNEDSIVIHVTFLEGGRETKLFLASDVDHETLSAIVQTSRKHGNERRLYWDVMKLPHHCSYLSLGPERGQDEAQPAPDVKWLFEDAREGSYIVSPSCPIPEKGADDDNDQPPHRQAANYHRRISAGCDGTFTVTMEYPSKANPKSFAYSVTALGVGLEIAAPRVSRTASASTPRAG